MKSRGFADGPFQMFIAVIVMAMSLTIGFYLMNTVNCWKCTETAKVESTNFREALSNVGRSDQGTMKKVQVEVPSCVDGYYLKHITGSGLNCKYFCPEHPNECWVLSWESECGGEQSTECIDIPGDIDIDYKADNIVFRSSAGAPGEQTFSSDADVFAQSTYFLGIYKSSPTTIEIDWA
jgi:hypothetical protein